LRRFVAGKTKDNPEPSLAISPFTEFYLLGLDVKAVDYPRQLVVVQEEKVIAGIINHQHEVATYWIEVAIDGVGNNVLEPVTLEDNGRWEGIVSFTPQKSWRQAKSRIPIT